MTVLDERSVESTTQLDTLLAHRLRTMDRSGDSTITWDPAAEVEVAAARTHFDKMRGQGYLAYKVDGDDREVLRRFDPTVGEIVMTPPLVGG